MYTLSSYSVLKYAAVTCLALGNKKFLCHVFNKNASSHQQARYVKDSISKRSSFSEKNPLQRRPKARKNSHRLRKLHHFISSLTEISFTFFISQILCEKTKTRNVLYVLNQMILNGPTATVFQNLGFNYTTECNISPINVRKIIKHFGYILG